MHSHYQQHRLQVCYQCHRQRRQNFSTSFTSVDDTSGKFASGVNDTGGKFATGVNNTSGKQWKQLSNCWKLKMNFKEKINYMLTLLPRGVQKK